VSCYQPTQLSIYCLRALDVDRARAIGRVTRIWNAVGPGFLHDTVSYWLTLHKYFFCGVVVLDYSYACRMHPQVVCRVWICATGEMI